MKKDHYNLYIGDHLHIEINFSGGNPSSFKVWGDKTPPIYANTYCFSNLEELSDYFLYYNNRKVWNKVNKKWFRRSKKIVPYTFSIIV